MREPNHPVAGLMDLDFQWQGFDPFIMTMHHNDAYPRGTEVQGRIP